jgi:sensor domain CHASE-containing protein
MQKRALSAQILLTTLLVLIIVAIIVVGVIAVVRRDVQQTVANQLYQDLYNVSENSIFEIIDLYTSERTTITLAQLQEDLPQAACSMMQTSKDLDVRSLVPTPLPFYSCVILQT